MEKKGDDKGKHFPIPRDVFLLGAFYSFVFIFVYVVDSSAFSTSSFLFFDLLFFY